MDIKEKREKLYRHCHKCGCGYCHHELANICVSDEEIEKNYEIVFGKEESIAPSKEENYMDELKELLKSKIEHCAKCIKNSSSDASGWIITDASMGANGEEAKANLAYICGVIDLANELKRMLKDGEKDERI